MPEGLARVVDQSAAPVLAQATVSRIFDRFDGAADRLCDSDGPTSLGRALVAVVAGSNALARVCQRDPRALDVLETLDRVVELDETDREGLARTKQLELLRIAARDLLGMDGLDEVGLSLARLADGVLKKSIRIACRADPGVERLAVVAMGKLGGDELNYASDVDVVFVTPDIARDEAGRAVLEVARACARVDTDLRPEGRSGPLTRSLSSYEAYWENWAEPWEIQALLKARRAAGDSRLGERFEEAAGIVLWERQHSPEALAQARRMKARGEALVARRGVDRRDLKHGPGGIRDVEFAVQLLQLVHGRHDPSLRSRSTLPALRSLDEGGYVASEDASGLASAYRFLRTVEHRLQLIEEEQVHTVPADPAMLRRLALVMGYVDTPARAAVEHFERDIAHWRGVARSIHERLFFRPLLDEVFAVSHRDGAGGARAGGILGQEALRERLAAFGFPDAGRTRAAVVQLAQGLTRTSRLMESMLPLILDWLSLAPDPDLGLLALQDLFAQSHAKRMLATTFRESPEAARRLCLLVGSSRMFGEAVGHDPGLAGSLDDERLLAPLSRDDVAEEALERLEAQPDPRRRNLLLLRFHREQVARIAARDLLGIDDVREVGRSLTDLAEGILEAALGSIGRELPICLVGAGRLGGFELGYGSDLDLLVVHGGNTTTDQERAESSTLELLEVLHGASPAGRVVSVDLALRPEGRLGPMTRSLTAYSTYFDRWALTWERQAMLRARVVAGDPEVGRSFMSLVEHFVWGSAFTDDQAREVRRMKARIERERIPPRQDPEFHLKLGRGALSDVEWTVQLLQLQSALRGTGTMEVLESLRDSGVLAGDDSRTLSRAYRFCERVRNRWHLVGLLPGGSFPSDALPVESPEIAKLARSLGTMPSTLREEYRRATRDARRVVERLFYAMDGTA